VRAQFGLRLLAAVQAFLLLAALVMPALAAAAEIHTDLWLYQDGDTVTVNGIDYGPSEIVDIVTTDPVGAIVDAGTATTDESGAFVYAFVLRATSPGIYDVVATGRNSGLTATTTFDPPNLGFTFDAPAPASVAYSDVVTFTGTFTCINNGSSAGNRCPNTTQNYTMTIAARPSGTFLDVAAASFNVLFTASSSGCTATCTVPWSLTWQAGRDLSAGTTGPGTYDVRATSTITGGNVTRTAALTIVRENTVTTYGGSTTGNAGTPLAMSSTVADLDGGVGAGNGVFAPDANLATTSDSVDGVRYQLFSGVSCTGSSPAGPTDDGINDAGAATGETLTLPGTAGTYFLKTTYLGNPYYLTSNTCTTITVSTADNTVSKPTLESPTDGSVSGDNTPTFDWTDVSDPSAPVTYSLQYVAKGATCDFTSATTVSSLSSSTFTPASSIGADGFYCWRAKAFDGVGNDSGYTSPFELRLDTTKPVITATAKKADLSTYTAGTWTNQSVTVTFSCADTGSGLATNTVGGGGTLTTDTSTGSFTNTGGCTDNAGNAAAPVTFSPIKIDKTAPVITATATKADTTPYIANTWTNQNVTVSFTCADGLSGLASNTVGGGGTQSAETSTGSFTNTGGCTDNAGNSATPVTFGPIKIDKTAPVISSSAVKADTTAYVANTWTNQDVTVHFTCADTGAVESGIVTDTVNLDDATVTTEGAAQFVSSDGACIDAAGNFDSSETFSPIKIDKTGPVITATAKKADLSTYTAGTWTNQSVTVTFSCADTGSGLATNTVGGGGTLTTDTSTGSFTNTGGCTDNAGNAAAPVTFSPIKIDKTAPVITATATKADTTPYIANTWTNQNVTVSFTCADGLSGLASNTVGGGGTQSAETSTGSFTNTGGCTDNAGNSATPVTFGPIKIDKTAPVISSSAVKADTTAYVANTWTNQDVTVHFTCADTGAVESGIVTDTVNLDDATVTTEGAAQFVSSDGACIDAAGNFDSSETFSPIKIDKTGPVITATAKKADLSTYTAGTWTNQSVTVTFSCADSGGSGIDTNTVGGGGTQSAETATGSFTNTGTCSDTAGNVATPVTFGPIKIDKTAPVISSSAVANALPYTAGTWTKYDVTVSFTCADDGPVQSGIVTNTVSLDNSTVSTEGAAQFRSSDGDCIDAAGNSDSSETFGPIKIDKTAPVISSSAVANALPYTAGTWTKYDVTVSFTCADDGPVQSGIVTNTVSLDNSTVSTEGAAQFRSSDGDCIDAAGNSDSSETFGPIKIDKTAPVISGAASPGANGFGWNKTSVAVTFTCADTGSVQAGIETDDVATDNQTLSAETSGTTVFSDGTCLDKAGNSDTFASVGPIKIDLTNPMVSITSPSSGLITVAASITVTGTYSDSPSGIDTVSVNTVTASLGATFTSANVALACGNNTVTALATDKAGRTNTSSINVMRVCIGSLTYYQPLDQSTGSTVPTINQGKMGRVIPVKITGSLSLGGSPVVMTDTFLTANGLTLRIGVNSATCAGNATTDLVEAYADAGAANDNTNLFRWSSGQWIYNLDTGKPPSVTMTIGKCYRIDVYVQDAVGTKVLVSTGPAPGTNPYVIFQPTK
jgi:hypothetical protein